MRRLRRWYAWWRTHAPRIRDFLYMFFGLLTVVAQASTGDSGWHLKGWAVLTAGVVSSVALLWRRRFPITVTLIGIVAMLVGGIFVPLGLALLTLAIRRRDLILAILTFLGYVALVANSGLTGEAFWVSV